METDEENWLRLAERLKIEVIVPFAIELTSGRAAFTALFPQFGAARGMVVDADWSAIEPHVSALLEAGFSFSCVGTDGEGDDKSAREMFSDWGWAAETERPQWVQKANVRDGS